MKPREVPIPDRLAHLEKDSRGIPIPYFVPIVDGKPNFKYADLPKLKDCAERKLCGVCGRRMDKRMYYFVGGPFTLMNKVSTDAPMHKECGEYALKACPHMFYEKAERTVEGSAFEKEVHIADKPSKLYLILSYSFDYRRIQGHWLFKFKVLGAARYVYKDNELVFDQQVYVNEEVYENQSYIREYNKKHGLS